MNKKALLYKYAKRYSYIIKQAYNKFFNRDIVPRGMIPMGGTMADRSVGSALSKGLAQQAWKVHKYAWDRYPIPPRYVDSRGTYNEWKRKADWIRECRMDAITKGMEPLASKWQPQISPSYEYREAVAEPYAHTIRKLTKELADNNVQLSPQEFANRILAYQRYNRGNFDYGTIGEVASRQLQAANARQFYTRNFDPRFQKYIQGAPVHIHKSVENNGSAHMTDSTIDIRSKWYRRIRPTIFGHEAGHLSYRLENPDELTENAVAPLFNREPIGGSGFLGGIDNTKSITMPDGTVMDANHVRYADELRANKMQVEAVERAIAEGLQKGTMTPRQAAILRNDAMNLYAWSDNSYRSELLNEPSKVVPMPTEKGVQKVQRVIDADNRAHDINIKEMLNVRPADRLWNQAYGQGMLERFDKKLGPDTRIGTIDAVLHNIDEEIGSLRRSQEWRGSTKEDTEKLNNLIANKQWLLDNKTAIQENMKNIRKANRIEGKGIALQNEIARLKKKLNSPAVTNKMIQQLVDGAKKLGIDISQIPENQSIMETIFNRIMQMDPAKLVAMDSLKMNAVPNISYTGTKGTAAVLEKQIRKALKHGTVPTAEDIKANKAIEEKIDELQRRYIDLRISLNKYPETTRQWLLRQPEIITALGASIK